MMKESVLNPTCTKCGAIQPKQNTKYCDYCGAATRPPSEEELEAARKLSEEIEKSESMPVNTLDPASQGKSFEIIGIVFGTSSKQAFWGLSTQADRLSRAYQAALSNLKYEATLLKADAVFGVTFALNNSTGSGNSMFTGSSEAVMLLGTAIRYKK